MHPRCCGGRSRKGIEGQRPQLIEQKESAYLALAVLEAVCRECLKGLSKFLFHGAQIAFQMFVCDEVEKWLDAFFLGLFPDLTRSGGSVVEVMPKFVQDQTFEDDLGVSFFAQERQGVDKDDRCFKAGVSEIMSCDQTDAKDFSCDLPTQTDAPSADTGDLLERFGALLGEIVQSERTFLCGGVASVLQKRPCDPLSLFGCEGECGDRL